MLDISKKGAQSTCCQTLTTGELKGACRTTAADQYNSARYHGAHKREFGGHYPGCKARTAGLRIAMFLYTCAWLLRCSKAQLKTLNPCVQAYATVQV